MTTQTNSLSSSMELQTLFIPKKKGTSDKNAKTLVDSLHPMRELTEDKKISAKKIELSSTDDVLSNLVEKIKKDAQLKKMVLEFLDLKDETSTKIKKLLQEGPKNGKNIEDGWIMVEKGPQEDKTSSGFAPYMIVTYPVKFLFSGVWMTTKFTYTCAKTLYNSFYQLQSVVSVGLFVLMGINTIRGDNFYVLRKLIQVVLNVIQKGKNTVSK